MNNFDPKIHIRKFGFETYGFGSLLRYIIRCDLYMKEIVFEFFDNKNNHVDSIGYKLSDGEINEMLNLLEWKQFEKYREITENWSFF